MFTFLFWSLVISYFILLNGTDGKTITFNFNTNENQKVVNIRGNSSNIITVAKIPSSVSALLFGVHSHVENITLSEKRKPCFQCSVTGRNVGMVYRLSTWEAEAHMWLLNEIQNDIPVLIIITALDFYSPVPGACNMEFPTEIAPYLRLKTSSGKIYVEYQHANVGLYRDEVPPSCSLSLPYLTYDIYVSYLKESDFGQDEYFNVISRMSNISLIKQTSSKVPSYSVHPDTRFSFLMYPNVGVVYNIVAKYTVNGMNKEALYVPISSYGCGNNEFTDRGCNLSHAFEEKAFLFVLSMYGFITAFFGHLFYGSTMFFFGFLSSFFITLILFGRYLELPKTSIIGLAVICGILGGIAWFLVHRLLQLSVITLLLVGFVFGFLITATVLYTPVGNLEINFNTKNYWLLLTTGSLVVTIGFIAFPIVLSIVGSSVVGTYVMLLFYDDFIGTRLSYIILNVVKRAISEDLEFAANDLPFQIKDALISVAWVAISIFAIIVQSRRLPSASPDCRCSCLTKLRCCKSHRLNCNDDFDPHAPLYSSRSISYNTFSN